MSVKQSEIDFETMGVIWPEDEVEVLTEEEGFEDDGTLKGKLDNSNIIRNISFDQKEIMYNIQELYNDGNPFDCDLTASSLKFYEPKKSDRYAIQEPKHLFDVYPQFDRVRKITPFQKVPMDDCAVHSVVVDLPFVISPHNAPSAKESKDTSCLIFKRFASFYPVGELYENIYWWLSECYRLLDDGGICVWKMQSTISGGISHWSVPFSFMSAQKIGFYCIDEFILEAKARLISAVKYKKQMHARKYTSTFFVFKKDRKKADKWNYFTMLENMSRETLEGKVWEVK